MSTDHRPSVNQLLTDTSVKYPPTINQGSAKCRRNVGEVSVNEKPGRDTSGTTIGRVSTECRPTIDRLSTSISTDYRPSVDRLSTECRPTIDQVSTAISTAISTDISVDITHSKQDPKFLHQTPQNHSFVSREETTPRSLGGQIKVSFITLGNCISQRKITVFIRL